MKAVYPAIYSDEFGKEQTVIENDGQTLRMVVRGVEFEGHDFDDFEPINIRLSLQRPLFVLNHSELCDCKIECNIPISIVYEDVVSPAALHILLELGKPQANGRIDEENLFLTLIYNDLSLSSSGKSGWFEDELLEIQAALPANIYMKICMNCAFSDYSVYGHGLFGCMLCFRNRKEEYLAVHTKNDYMKLMDGFAGVVQETYLCPEFMRRTPGTGYRG